MQNNVSWQLQLEKSDPRTISEKDHPKYLQHSLQEYCEIKIMLVWHDFFLHNMCRSQNTPCTFANDFSHELSIHILVASFSTVWTPVVNWEFLKQFASSLWNKMAENVTVEKLMKCLPALPFHLQNWFVLLAGCTSKHTSHLNAQFC